MKIKVIIEIDKSGKNGPDTKVKGSNITKK